MFRHIAEVMRVMIRVLTFRATREELDTLGWKTLPVALPIVWLVGFGRWWDDPTPLSPLHRSGLGSVMYVFALSLFLWLMGLPLRGRPLSYAKVVAFVSLTALPAALYAIPVELYTSGEMAVRLNIAFLAVVSVYRVGLLYWFFIRGAGMNAWIAAVATLTPISMIGAGLVVIGLLEGIIQIMGGLRESAPSAQAYEAITSISCMLVFGAPVLIILWLVAAIRNVGSRRDSI